MSPLNTCLHAGSFSRFKSSKFNREPENGCPSAAELHGTRRPRGPGPCPRLASALLQKKPEAHLQAVKENPPGGGWEGAPHQG